METVRTGIRRESWSICYSYKIKSIPSTLFKKSFGCSLVACLFEKVTPVSHFDLELSMLLKVTLNTGSSNFNFKFGVTGMCQPLLDFG